MIQFAVKILSDFVEKLERFYLRRAASDLKACTDSIWSCFKATTEPHHTPEKFSEKLFLKWNFQKKEKKVEEFRSTVHSSSH